MAVSKRAQELAEELLRVEGSLPSRSYRGPVAVLPPGVVNSGIPSQHYSGLADSKLWLMSQYRKNPKLFMVGGISVLVVLTAVIGFSIYKKKKDAEAKSAF